MRIQEIGGEFSLIERLRTRFAGPGDGSFLGIGDDAAVLDLPAGHQLVVTTDMLVETVHFRRDWSDFYSIGWKSAAVNLSDIAAMGAVPTYTFVALGLTSNETVESIDTLYTGLTDCLVQNGAKLAGGDTNGAPKHLVIAVTQLGVVPTGLALTRTAALPGDRLLVTGTLGDSAAGLLLLQRYGSAEAEKRSAVLVDRHRRPIPRVEAGLAAAATGKIHAAMDLSDGLLGDLRKLCIASGVGACVQSGSIPVSSELKAFAVDEDFDPTLTAIRGGEDYELLFCVAVEDAEQVKMAVEAAGLAITDVGEVTKEGFRIEGAGAEVATGGWDHFA